MQNTSNNISAEAADDINVRQAALLTEEVRQARVAFEKESGELLQEAEHALEAAKKEAAGIDKELRLFEKRIVKKIDDIILEFAEGGGESENTA